MCWVSRRSLGCLVILACNNWTTSFRCNPTPQCSNCNSWPKATPSWKKKCNTRAISLVSKSTSKPQAYQWRNMPKWRNYLISPTVSESMSEGSMWSTRETSHWAISCRRWAVWEGHSRHYSDRRYRSIILSILSKDHQGLREKSLFKSELRKIRSRQEIVACQIHRKV